MVLYFKCLTKTVFQLLLNVFYTVPKSSLFLFVIPVEKAKGEQEVVKGHSPRTADLDHIVSC